jgi:hypothetical protein
MRLLGSWTASAAASVLLAALSLPIAAQSSNFKTAGGPRTADSKPIFAAPRTPDGKPDFSGIWEVDRSGDDSSDVKAMATLKAQPWAEAMARKRQNDLFKDDLGVLCLPAGPSITLGVGKIVQTPTLLLMLYSGTLYRQVFLDGRPLPEDPNPDWMGYSVGHWEGDTLVVESIGFNDRTWLDMAGHPHTESLKTTERIHRRDLGHLEIDKTFTDPKALQVPWTIPLKYKLDAEHEPMEYVCNENERDRQHMVGQASDEQNVSVAPEILAKYVGAYELQIPGGPRLIVQIDLSGGVLLITTDRIAPTALRARSQTDFFTPYGGIKFFEDDHGAVTYLIFSAVEGDLKAIRKSAPAAKN